MGVRMKVEFCDQRLPLVRTDRAAETKLPVSVIKSCREKLILLEAAPDERTLRNWKSLHYEKLSGDREGQRSIRLNKQWRLTFEFDDKMSPPTATILGVEDYH
jgi:toxin HigB-1